MSDFPATLLQMPPGACIHTSSPQAATYNIGVNDAVNFAAAAWPAANLGIAIPICIEQPVTACQMFWENGAVAGTTDVGIYDDSFKRLVSLGATTNAGTIQIGNITDTALKPGCYYMAMVVSTITTETILSYVTTAVEMRACGVVQQAIGAATLPDPFVPAVMAQAFCPFMGISFNSVM